MGYVPAMCFLAAFYMTVEGGQYKFFAHNLYLEAIDVYKSPEAMVAFGEQLLSGKALNVFSKSQALNYFKRAIDLEYDYAHYAFGKALSPLSNVKGVSKNVGEAIKELELAGDIPGALHELAMLYYNGVGVRKDLQKANELQLKAKKLDRMIEPLHKPKTSIGTKFFTFVFLSLLAIILGVALNEYIKKIST